MKMVAFVHCLIVSVLCSSISQGHSVPPAKLSPAVITAEARGSCPSNEILTAQMDATRGEVRDLLHNATPPCACGGTGLWTRIARLDINDTSQQCPSNWNLITTPVRGCGRSSTSSRTCDSAFFPFNGRSYSRVCGRVNAYQKGTPNAFEASVTGFNPGLEGAYIDGVSLTHGAAGSRQHIWSFAAALYENDPSPTQRYICSCTINGTNWPYQVPSFVGNNSYFCATGNSGPGFNGGKYYADNPLWDGEGCGPTNACCQLNNPPWFCTTLPQPTTDDIELRICQDQNVANEDVIITIIDISVM